MTVTDLVPITTITHRIRAVFILYAVVSAVISIYVWDTYYPFLHWDWIYRIIFPISIASCVFMAVRPKIGEGALFLFPIFLGSVILIIDLWLSYFQGMNKLGSTAASTSGWTLLLVSIAYIDLLESRIYHRMVAYIEQENSD